MGGEREGNRERRLVSRKVQGRPSSTGPIAISVISDPRGGYPRIGGTREGGPHSQDRSNSYPALDLIVSPMINQSINPSSRVEGVVHGQVSSEAHTAPTKHTHDKKLVGKIMVPRNDGDVSNCR